MPSNIAHRIENRPLIFPRSRRESIGSFRFKTTASGSQRNIRIPFLLPLSAYMAGNTRGLALALQSAVELSKTTVDEFGQNRPSVRDRLSISRCRAICRAKGQFAG